MAGPIGTREVCSSSRRRGNAIPTEQAWQLFIQWVENVHNDGSHANQRDKVIDNKPARAVDGLADRDAIRGRAADLQPSARFRMQNPIPSFAFPRYVADGPLAADTIKCHLKPLGPHDYTVTFTAAEWARLESIFPRGVCDWSRRGVQQRPVVPRGSFGPSRHNLVFDITDRDDYLP